MKILAVMGSPRGKGAGYRIVRKIEERMQALDGSQMVHELGVAAPPRQKRLWES